MKFLKQSSLNPAVFLPSAAIILFLVLAAIFSPQTLQSVFAVTEVWILENAGWFYMLTVAIILLVVLYLAISRYGDIKLGPDHSLPEFGDIP